MPTFLLNFFSSTIKENSKNKKQKTKIRDILQFSSLIYNLYNAKIRLDFSKNMIIKG